MPHGDAGKLLSAMSQYGYSLLQPEQAADPNELLGALSRSEDARVLEGFPVVLANALMGRRGAVDLGAAQALLKGEPARERFRRLAALSFQLFGLYGFDSLAPAEVRARPDRWTLDGEAKRAFEEDRPLVLGHNQLDPARVKRTFLRYFVQSRAAEDAESKAQLREDFRREYQLSLFFAPKQRDLLRKKLRGEPLTKTEREYFSRVVKKKLAALADPDLHRLAQKALQ